MSNLTIEDYQRIARENQGESVGRAAEKIVGILSKWKSAAFRMSNAMHEYLWYESLTKAFPDPDSEPHIGFKKAMELLAGFYHAVEAGSVK